MELLNQFYLGNDTEKSFYDFPLPLGEVDGVSVYEGDSCLLPFCQLSDRELYDDTDPEYDDIPF